MPREQLHALAADVNRLLGAGGAVAAGDEGLRRHGMALRKLGEQVPALARLAEAADRVTHAPGPEQTSRGLLDLLLGVRQVQAGLTTADVPGTLRPVAPSGPWATSAPVGDLYPLASLDGDRLDDLQEAHRRGTATDLRLVEPLLRGLGDRRWELGELLVNEVVPAFGPTVVPEIQEGFNLNGGIADARRLALLHRLDQAVSVRLCRRALRCGSAAVRGQALDLLPSFGSPQEVDRAARRALAGGDERLRWGALRALDGLASVSRAAVPGLLKCLGEYYDTAAEILGKVGKPAVRPLLATLQHTKNMYDRRGVFNALANIGPDAAAAVPVLRRFVKPGSPRNTEDRALYALGKIGPGAAAVIPDLLAILHDTGAEAYLRDVAAVALARIDGEEKILPLLGDKRARVRQRAALALGRVDPSKAAAAVPALVQALADTSAAVRLEAAGSLADLGRPEARLAVPVLVAALKERNYDTRREAARALGEIGPAARQALPALREACQDKNQYIREAAAEALAAVTDKPGPM